MHPKLCVVVTTLLYCSSGLIGYIKAYKRQSLSFLVNILGVLIQN